MILTLKKYFNYSKIIFELCKKDFCEFRSNTLDQIINNIFFIIIIIASFKFLIQSELIYLTKFMLIAIAALRAFYNTMRNVIVLAADISGQNSLKYELTLPIPQNCIFIKIALSTALRSFCISTLFLPLCKLLFWKTINLSEIKLIKYYFILAIACIFYGFFLLTILYFVDNLYKLNNLWMRIFTPLTSLGCTFASWQTIYSISPLLGVINLFNPLTYVFDGIRSTGFPEKDFIPYWNCIAALLFFSFFFGICGIKLLKRKLDCI